MCLQFRFRPIHTVRRRRVTWANPGDLVSSVTLRFPFPAQWPLTFFCQNSTCVEKGSRASIFFHLLPHTWAQVGFGALSREQAALFSDMGYFKSNTNQRFHSAIFFRIKDF
ncbi:hypothetical protein JTE90_013721 [Oedothorax gibbosus]|uniref:Uncharacterized protein n=1 Tax=Oedothorax gibbosus TaxID=931172 RepID=A0AAV6UXN4_9ARAC|nr:hypothetical protein JTE90_013721 [Oedothorax gibbosus]